MSVIKVERKDHPSGRDDADSDELVQRWRIYVDDPVDAPAQALTYGGLPKRGDAYSVALPRFRCIARDVDRISESPKVLIGTYKFSTKYDAAKMEAKELQPLDRRPLISWTSQIHTVAWLRDQVTNEVLTNTVGDHFAGLTREESLIAYDATVNTATQPDWLIDVLDCINDADVTIRGRLWPAESLKVVSASCSDQLSEMDQLYFKVNVKLLGNRDGWKGKILNAGYRQLVNGAPQPIQIGGEDVNEPQLLDASSAHIKPSDLAADPINLPHWIEKYRNRLASFTALGLPPLPLSS